MADNIGTTTTTTTTTSTVHRVGISCNVKYITSLPGILKILELIFGLLCWALIASFGRGIPPAFQFVLFVTVTSWVLTLISLGLFMLALHATMCSAAPWPIIEFFFNLFWGVLYFIAACIIASYTQYHNDTISAATAFAFFTTIVYIIHTVFSFKAWRGVFPWQGGCSSANSGNSAAV